MAGGFLFPISKEEAIKIDLDKKANPEICTLNPPFYNI